MNLGETPNSFRTTHCERHGDMQEAFVCEHLLQGSHLGLFTDPKDTSNPRPDAWCSSCERVRLEPGGWNEQSEAQIKVKLVCGGCYDEIKERNVLVSDGRSQVQ
jgi:hypothetical protein